jgi:hypothetical protein
VVVYFLSFVFGIRQYLNPSILLELQQSPRLTMLLETSRHQLFRYDPTSMTTGEGNFYFTVPASHVDCSSPVPTITHSERSTQHHGGLVRVTNRFNHTSNTFVSMSSICDEDLFSAICLSTEFYYKAISTSIVYTSH